MVDSMTVFIIAVILTLLVIFVMFKYIFDQIFYIKERIHNLDHNVSNHKYDTTLKCNYICDSINIPRYDEKDNIENFTKRWFDKINEDRTEANVYDFWLKAMESNKFKTRSKEQ